jgi:hypothetical protein
VRAYRSCALLARRQFDFFVVCERAIDRSVVDGAVGTKTLGRKRAVCARFRPVGMVELAMAGAVAPSTTITANLLICGRLPHRGAVHMTRYRLLFLGDNQATSAVGLRHAQ